MGNIPNKWWARASVLGAAVFVAICAYALGQEAARRLASGFTFDWYVHAGRAAYADSEVLLVASIAASAAASLAVGIVGFGASWFTRARMRALRHVPPRYGDATGLDVHLGRLLFALPILAGVLALLLGYVVLSSPMLFERGAAGVTRLSPNGYVVIVSLASALGGLVGGLVAGLTTHVGLVSGRLVPKSDRNLIARVSLFGMRNAKTTVALVLGVTLVAGYYASGITTNVDVADVLPRGDPNTDAAHNLTAKFKSSFTQQVTFQFRVLDPANATQKALYDAESTQKLPERVTEERPGNITDELYVRAMAEVIDFATKQHPFAGSSGIADIYKLINWTLAGGEGSENQAGNLSFSLPPTDQAGAIRYEAVDRGVNAAVYSAVDALVSPSWRQTAVLVTADPGADVTTKDIGEAGLRVRELWLEEVRAGRTQYTVFGDANPPLFSVDLPIANAHASELTRADFTLLLPIIAAFIAATLFIAFRNVVSVVATFSMLAVAVTWTFGVMGWLGIPLNTLNLAVVPLIMGVGIDYGIHMMNEYQEQRAHGKTPEQAWIVAGGGSALALFVGMLTTAAGLLVMVASPSLLVAQLGLLANIALVSCYTLAVLFIPAVVTLVGRERKANAKKAAYQPSVVMPAIAAGVSRARWAVLVVVLLMAGAALASAATIHREAFGDPPRNWLPDDPLRQEHERAINGFYDTTVDDVKANVLIFEGDLADPAAHRYIAAITATLRQNDLRGYYLANESDAANRTESRVIGDTLKDLPFIVETYLTVQGGIDGAAQYLGANALGPILESRGLADPTGSTETYPQTRAEIVRTLDGMFASPLHQFGNIFIDKHDYRTAVTIFSVRAATYEDAEAVWNEVQTAIKANEDLKPAGMQVSFFGNTAINYLFVAKQVPWLGYMSIATNIVVIVIVFAFTRDVRATALVGALNFLTSTLWVGFLPFIGIGLAINLTLPLVFIFCMGSDYGLHLGMRCKRTGDTRGTMESVGKGVLFSFLTTFGAFLVFTRISDLAGRRAMVATALAIAIVFLVTLLTVPIFYPVKRRKGQKGRSGDTRTVPVVEKRAEDAPVVIQARATPPEPGGGTRR